MSDTTALEDLLFQQVQELYSGEHLIVTAMPRFILNANDITLNAALVQHVEEMELHKERLEELMRYLDLKPSFKPVGFIENIIADTQGQMQVEIYESLDMTMIAAMEKMLDHLMGLYDAAILLAYQLGFHFASELLSASLQEKSDTVVSLGQFKVMINDGIRATA